MTVADDLRAVLTRDWQLALEVQGHMKAAGYTVDQVRSAKRKLGVSSATGAVSRRNGRWWWRLPPDGCPTCQRGFRGPWVIQLTKPRPPEGVYGTWPEYLAVTCSACGQTAGMYHQPQSITCDRCAHCTTPTPTATSHIA